MKLVSLLTLQGKNNKQQQNPNINVHNNVTKAISNNIDGLNKIQMSTYDIPNAIRYNSNFFQTNFYMSPSEIVNKTNLLKDAAENGYIYTLDTEMFGIVPDKLNLNKFGNIETETANNIINANREANVMTELFISKQGRNGVSETFARVSNTSDFESMSKLVELVKDNSKTNNLGFIFQRAAGSEDSFRFKAMKYPTYFNENADILNDDTIRRGLQEISSKSQYKKGTPEFKQGAQNILDKLLQIAEEEHSVIQTMNGQNFDFDVIFDYFKMAGLEVTNEQKEKILSKHVDTQRLFMNTEVKDKIYQYIRNRKDYLITEARKAFKNGDIEKYNKLSKQAEAIEENLTNTGVYNAAQGKLGRTFDRGESATHNAPYDVGTTEMGTKVFYEDLYEAANKIEKDMNNAAEREGYFLANGNNILDKEKDIFFSNSFEDITNTYNQVSTENGHLYKVNMYELNKDTQLDYDGLSAQGIADVQQYIKDGNKYVLEFEDQYNYLTGSMNSNSQRGTRKSYIITDNKNILQDIINEGKLSYVGNNNEVVDTAIESTRASIALQVQKEREGWIRPDRKGYKSFTNYLDAYKEWNNYVKTNNYEGDIRSFLLNASEDEIASNLPSLTNRDGRLITERASKFIGLYKDLDENYDYYNVLRTQVEEVASSYKLKKIYGDNSKYVENTIQTKTLNEVKSSLDNYMYSNITDEDEMIRLTYEANMNEVMKMDLEDRVDEIMKESNTTTKLEDAYNIARRENFAKDFNVEFDRNLKVVRDSILGYESVKPNINSINVMDVLNGNGEYFSINTSSRRNIEDGLNKLLNIGNYSNGNSPNRIRRNRARNAHLNDIVEDLAKRNLISKKDYNIYSSIRNDSSVNNKIQHITNAIMNNKNSVLNIAGKYTKNPNKQIGLLNLDINDIKYDDEYKKVYDYLNMSNMNYKTSLKDGYVKMNRKSRSEFLRTLNREELTKVLNNTPDDAVDLIYGTGGKIDTLKAENVLMSNLGFSENNANIFVKNIINNDNNSTFKIYTNSGEIKKVGISNTVKMINGKGYLFTVTNDNLNRLETDLMQGVKRSDFTLDDIKKYAMVFKLDKVEETNGGPKIIKQSGTSFKAMTGDIVRRDNVFKLENTYDQVLYKLKNKYENALKYMSTGNYEKANKVISSASRGIAEEKSLSAALVVPDGKGGFIKQQRMSISDYMLKDKYNISGLTQAVPEVLKNNNELKKKLSDLIGDNGIKNLLEKKIPKYTPYEQMDIGFKQWFALNSKDIASEILKSDFINAYTDKNLVNLLETMKEKGVAMFLTKESGEAAKGFINKVPVNEYIAGSHYSKASRPLLDQVLNSSPIKRSDFDYYYREMTGESLFNSDGSNKLGIKFGRSWVTEEFLEKEKLSNKKGLTQGMSVMTKFMSSQEYADTIKKFSNISEGNAEIQKIMSTYGKNIEDIRNMAVKITSTTSLYEDSSLISPILARLLGQRGIVSEPVPDGDSIANHAIGSIFKDKEVIGYNKEKNELLLRNLNKYFDSKLAIGYSEKSEFHTVANLTKEELPFAEEVFNLMFGGAKLVANPNIAKHEALNSILPFYMNAITDNISTENEAKAINKIFEKHMPWQKQTVKFENGRYIVVEGLKVGNGNGPLGFLNAIEEISGINKNIKNNIDKINEYHIGRMDVSLMQDNTIEKRAMENLLGYVEGGSKINYRSQQIIGMFIGDDPTEELTKYRKRINGKTVSLLDDVIQDQIDEMLRDEKVIKAMEQSANINTALIEQLNLSSGKNIKNVKARILNMPLDKAASAYGLMEASALPDIFTMYKKMGKNDVKVNAYKIDISNLQLDNPIYREFFDVVDERTQKPSRAIQDLLRKTGRTAKEYTEKFGINSKINTLFIPAMDAATLKNGEKVQYNLLNIQKSAADLINTLSDLQESNFTDNNYMELRAKANEQLKQYYEDLMFEMTDRNGYFKRNLEVRAKNSARLKVANIAAPLEIDNSFILNKSIDRINKTYRPIAVVNEADFFGGDKVVISKAYDNIGKQLIKDNIDDTDEFVNFFNKYYKQNIKNVSEISSLGIGEETYNDFARKYLREVGSAGLDMRDPAMLTSSEQAVRTFINDNVTAGTVWLDPVMAKLMNGDGDGDEINAYFSALDKNTDGEYILKSKKNKVVKGIDETIEANKSNYFNLFNNLKENYAEKQIKMENAWNIKGYYEEYIANAVKNGNPDGVIDYIYDQAVQNMNARLLKKSIGQVSNPNYFLKAGKTVFFENRELTPENVRMSRNIGYLTDITEQSLIDTKSVTNLEQSKRLYEIAGNYRTNLDKLMDLKNDNRESALMSLINDVAPILTDDSRIQWASKDILSETGELDLSKVKELAKQLLKGEYTRGTDFTSVEEIFGDMLKVMNDKKVNNVLWSEITRQNNLSSLGSVRLTLMDKMIRAAQVMSPDNPQNAPKLFREIYSRDFRQSVPVLNDILLAEGGYLKDSNYKTPGIFRITRIARDENGNASIALQDVINHGERKISGLNYDKVTRKMKSYSVIGSDRNKESEALRSKLKSVYENGMTTSFGINEKVFGKITGDYVENPVIEELQNTYDKEKVTDFLQKTKILKKEGYLNDDEISMLQEAMNEHIKKAGSRQQYDDALYKNLSTLDSFKKNNVNNGAQAKEYTEKFFTDEAIKSVKMEEKQSIINNELLEGMKAFIEDAIADDFVSEATEEMNKGIKKAGAKVKDTTNKYFKKATTALKDTFDNHKKGILIGAGATAASLGALWLMNNRDVSPDKNYKPKDNKQDPLIKSRSNGNNYQDVPTSDSKYYTNQDVGTAINVVAQAPSNSTGEDMSQLVQSALGSDININASYSDSTKKPTQDEVDSMIDNSI